MREFNKRQALRFPVEVHRRKRVLIEQRTIRALVWIVSLLFAWPLIVANKYTDSQRYRQAEYIEIVDVSIWLFALLLEIAWVVWIFATLAMLFSTNGT